MHIPELITSNGNDTFLTDKIKEGHYVIGKVVEATINKKHDHVTFKIDYDV